VLFSCENVFLALSIRLQISSFACPVGRMTDPKYLKDVTWAISSPLTETGLFCTSKHVLKNFVLPELISSPTNDA
jgi:hypothetical protein